MDLHKLSGDIPADVADKYKKLIEILTGMGSVIISLSGGVDSVFLVRVAHDVLGDKVLAITCDSPSFPHEEKELARQMAKEYGFRHKIIQTHEIENESYAANPSNRCYFCRQEMYGDIEAIAKEEGIACICDGFNFSDQGDYRPGHTAAVERKVRSPLFEAGLTKGDIRILAKAFGLPNWDRPASACLASRIPYGTRVTRERLNQIEKAEAFLRSLGFRQIRVRHHDKLARIETDPAEFPLFFESQNYVKISQSLKGLGFMYVTLDLQGYRTGSLNEEILKPKFK
jgi:uncharacterized protein